jgi:hypothetical protein
MNNEKIILGIHISDRLKEAGKVQQLLSTFGKIIKTRLGLHETESGDDNPGGLILLELTGPAKDKSTLEAELGKIQGVVLKKMVFNE